MSKNTGTSELINYFDLGVNGDVGISGNLTLDTIANATTDTDTFLVSDTGIIKYRTGAQLLSDIGAAPAVAGGYVPYTGATTNVDLGVYNLTTSAIIANGSGSNSGIVHLESNAIHSLVNGYGSIASGTTNQFNLYQTTGAGVFRGAILSLNSITEFATRTFTLPDTDGTIALTSNIPANPVGGTGTTNYLPKFTGASTIGNSNLINDTSGNLGLGVTPSAWSILSPAIEIGTGGSFISAQGSTSAIYIGTNAFFNGSNWIYKSNGLASYSIQNGGEHQWFRAASGTAGNAISFTQAMTLFSDGNLLVGSPSPITNNGARLQVSGTATISSTLTSSDLTIKNSANTETLDLFLSPSTFNGFIDYPSGRSLTIRNKGSLGGLTLASTGAATFSSTITSGDITTNGNYKGLYFNGTRNAILGNAVLEEIYLATANVTRVTIASSGNVGIGTPTPSGQLHLRGASGLPNFGDQMLQIESTTSNFSGIVFSGTNGSNAAIRSEGASTMSFWTASGTSYTKCMTMTSSGNVLIGTTTDNGSKLRVSGNIQIDGFQKMYTYYIIVQPNTTGTITISSPTGTNMQGSMQVMAGGYGNSLSGNITGLWMVGGLLFFNNASTSTITQIVNSVTANGSMSFQRSSDQYTVTLANTSSLYTKTLFVSVIINGD